MYLALPGLLAFCPGLDAVQQEAIAQRGQEACHLIGWAWLRRVILGPQTEKLAADFASDWQPVVTTLFGAWARAVRSSSAVVNCHSVLPPFTPASRYLTA